MTYPIKTSLSILLTIIISISFAQDIKKGKIPTWVKEIGNPTSSTFSKYDINNGGYTSLYDNQVNANTQEDFYHLTTKIYSQAGINWASQVQVEFDTSYQSLTFHYLKIHRDGKIIDRTEEIELSPLNQEEQLSQGLYSGKLTAHTILDDIRRNDQIEYAYTVKGFNPIYKGEFFAFNFLENINPIDVHNLRFITPKSMKVNLKCDDCEKLNIKRNIDGKNEIISLTQKDLPARDVDGTEPGWFIPFKFISLSSMDNWEQVNKWAWDIFDIKDNLNIDSTLSDILSSSLNKEEKITKLIDFVQKDIRYMGIESGIGNIQPTAPSKVLEQRFGDCKDKSLLLARLLKGIDIEAYPALVHTEFLGNITKLLPSGYIFDHCIVYLKHENKEYWIDPTATSQVGSFKNRFTSSYQKALIIKDGATTLNNMETKENESKISVTEQFRSDGINEPMNMKIVTKAVGLHADEYRLSLEYYSAKELGDQLRSSYSQVYPNLYSAKKLIIDDNETENVLTITEEYAIPDAWNDGKENEIPVDKFHYEPITLYNYIGGVNCDIKDNPVNLYFPSNYSQITTFKFHNTFIIDSSLDKLDNEYFFYQKRVTPISNKGMAISYQYKALNNHIMPKDFPDICKSINQEVQKLPMDVFFQK